jgi:hypothetical protein
MDCDLRIAHDHPDDGMIHGIGDGQGEYVHFVLRQLVTDDGKSTRLVREKDGELCNDFHGGNILRRGTRRIQSSAGAKRSNLSAQQRSWKSPNCRHPETLNRSWRIVCSEMTAGRALVWLSEPWAQAEAIALIV